MLRAARKAKGLVLREAGPELGFADGNNLAKYERGEELPGPKRLPRFAAFYGDVIDPDELMIAWAEARVSKELGMAVIVQRAATVEAAAAHVDGLRDPEGSPQPPEGTERRRHSRRATDPPPP